MTQADAAMIEKNYAVALSAWKVLAVIDPPAFNDRARGSLRSVSALRWSGYLDKGQVNDVVQLRLNDRVIASTTASQPRKDDAEAPATGFSFRMDRLWKYVGKGDFLSVSTDDGQALNIETIGDRLQVHASRKSLRHRLFRRLDAGAFINKHGKLQQPLDTGDTAPGVMALFEDAANRVETKFGLKAFVFYGTLLGCVRGGNFIAFDDDIDVAYVSQHNTPEAVKDEFKAICNFLIESGFQLLVKPFGTKVQYPNERRNRSFGLHYGWIDAERCLHVAFGHHGIPARVGASIEFRKGTLGAFTVDIPTQSEDILAMLYGESWRIPNPGFSHHTSTRKNDPAFHLSAAEVATFNSKDDEPGPDDD